ncbi:MAG: hypothetical protein WA057_02710 [Candidatus Magasanikiibacteriota bacterium]
MSKNILLVGILFISLFLGGCVLNNSGEKFVLTTEPQDAVFYIAYGWVGGGGGSMPVLDNQRNPLQYNNLPVAFDETQVDLVGNKLPSCYEGKPEIKVSAKIQLEKSSSINTSIPPDENGNQPEESFYSAKVLELKNIEVKAVECKD